MAAAERLELADMADMARGLLWGCWRYRWQACALAWAVGIAGWAIVFAIPDVYRASSRVYVDTQSTLRPLLRGLAVESDVLTDVNMMARAIVSRPNLERLARDTDLDIGASDQAAFESLINHLAASIVINKDGNNIVQVSYENNDPKKALAVVTAVLNSFIEGSLGENRSDASTAQRFLVEKLKEYEAKLNEAEANLAEFKRKNVGLMPGDGTDYFSRLQAEQTKLQDIEGRLRVARNRRAELQRQIGGEEPVFGLVPADPAAGGATTPQDRQIAQFEQQLTELRLKYTETHPDIVQIKRTIEALRAEKAAAARAAGPATRAYSPLDLNPVYQQMKIQLSQADVEIAQLQAEYSGQSAVVGALRRRVDTVPAIEAELKRLTRDYDVTKAQYDELLRRVESARLSEDADQSKDDVTFRIIDPPTVPALPVGPNRPLLFTGVLFLALAAGFGLAMAMNLTKPVFYTAKHLERRFGVNVLGSIRLVRTEAELAVARQNWMLMAGGVGALVVVYVVLMLFAGGPGVGQMAAGGA
jgi:polysaccharide chain length determinant protein (PEP-CTERM system associated)